MSRYDLIRLSRQNFTNLIGGLFVVAPATRYSHLTHLNSEEKKA